MINRTDGAASVFYPIMERLLWGSFEHFEPRRFQLQQTLPNRSYPLETLDPYPPKMFSSKVVVCRFELTSEKSPSESPDIFPTFFDSSNRLKISTAAFWSSKNLGCCPAGNCPGADASSYVQRVFNSSNYKHIKAHAVERE